MSKQIRLSQGKFAIVDDEDFDFLNQWKWCAAKNRNTYYAYRADNGKNIYMHRLILNAPAGIEVDHRHGNGLDNRRSEIRLCTHAENQHNYRKQSEATSQYKGITWNKHMKKWRVQIRSDGKHIDLGHFSNQIEAAHAYDEAARKYHGEFANTNFNA